MGLRRLLFTSVAAAMLLVMTLGSASAIVFATFSQTSTGYPFTYNAATGTFTESATVDFSFLALAPGSPYSTSGVTFTVTGMAMGPVNPGPPLQQPWQVTSFSFTKGGVNLLSGDMTGIASVQPAQNTGGYAGSMVGVFPDVINYSSDLIPAFVPPLSYAWSVESPTSNPWGFIDAGTGNFVSFTAAVNGSFSANASVVPEPGAVAMLLGVGISGSLFAFRRRRA